MGTSNLVEGGPGSGKTIFCLTAAMTLCGQGKKVLYMSFEEPEFRLRNHLRNFGLHPEEYEKKGVLMVKRFNALDIARSVAELEDRLSGSSTERGVRFSKDRKVAFSPLGLIKKEHHEKGTLSQDGAFIANYGVEGAEKLDAVAKVFTLKPYSWIVNNTSDKPIQSLSALCRDRGIGDGSLSADFYSNGSDRDGYVLPVSGSK